MWVVPFDLDRYKYCLRNCILILLIGPTDLIVELLIKFTVADEQFPNPVADDKFPILAMSELFDMIKRLMERQFDQGEILNKLVKESNGHAMTSGRKILLWG